MCVVYITLIKAYLLMVVILPYKNMSVLIQQKEENATFLFL